MFLPSGSFCRISSAFRRLLRSSRLPRAVGSAHIDEEPPKTKKTPRISSQTQPQILNPAIPKLLPLRTRQWWWTRIESYAVSCHRFMTVADKRVHRHRALPFLPGLHESWLEMSSHLLPTPAIFLSGADPSYFGRRLSSLCPLLLLRRDPSAISPFRTCRSICL